MQQSQPKTHGAAAATPVWHTWHTPVPERDIDPMLRTHLHTWRATLFVSLGLAAGGCAGKAVSEGAEGEDEESTSTNEDPPVRLPEHLRCDGDVPSELGVALRECANGIVHRPASAEESDCPGCPLRGPILYGTGPDACVDDADCRAGTLCIASSELVNATAECIQSVGYAPRQYLRHFACQTPEDECGADSQCSAGTTCALVGGARACTENVVCSGGVPGRPFLIGAEARVAELCAGQDWCGPALTPPDALDACSRVRAAQHWQAVALMEHASIAAFARFTLQLLGLGAPLELTLQSQAALRDETEHARRCFALAARYAGRHIGPGPLPMAGALSEESLASIVRLTFAEGCVGETCAALEAAEALEGATDAAVREALELIARDERRHAELAWHFVSWALEQDPTGAARDAVQAELQRLRREQNGQRPATSGHEDAERESSLRNHGVLGAERCRELRRAAILELVLPCAERLLARPRRGAYAAASAPAVALAATHPPMMMLGPIESAL